MGSILQKQRLPHTILESRVAAALFSCSEGGGHLYPVSEAFLNAVKAFTSLESIGNAYDFMVLCGTACNVTLAQDMATIEALPNGTENLSIYSDEYDIIGQVQRKPILRVS